MPPARVPAFAVPLFPLMWDVGFLLTSSSFVLGFWGRGWRIWKWGALGCLRVSLAQPWPASLQPNAFPCKQGGNSICVTGLFRIH